MCTIAVMWGTFRAWPVVVAANRDEFRNRSATAPLVLDEGPPRIIGGRDNRRAGTWMGATAKGFFVGVTNQRTGNPNDASLRSRGEVVLAALRLGTTDEVKRYLRDLDGAAYNPFNLVFGDAEALSVAYVRRKAPRVGIEALTPGVHVLANDRLGSLTFPKAARAAVAIQSLAPDMHLDALGEALRVVLASHDVPHEANTRRERSGSLAALLPHTMRRNLHALCVHTPVYGTVSATQMFLGDGHVARYRFAQGAPCTTPFYDVTTPFA